MIFNFPALVAESTSPSGVEPNLVALPTVRPEAKVVEAVPAVAVARGAEVVVAPSASPLLPAKTSTRSSTPTSRPAKMLRLSMKKRRKNTKQTKQKTCNQIRRWRRNFVFCLTFSIFFSKASYNSSIMPEMRLFISILPSSEFCLTPKFHNLFVRVFVNVLLNFEKLFFPTPSSPSYSFFPTYLIPPKRRKKNTFIIKNSKPS